MFFSSTTQTQTEGHSICKVMIAQTVHSLYKVQHRSAIITCKCQFIFTIISAVSISSWTVTTNSNVWYNYFHGPFNIHHSMHIMFHIIP